MALYSYSHLTGALLKWIETQKDSIDQRAFPVSERESFVKTSAELYLVLAQRTEGEALGTVKNTGEQNGGEAWRRLLQRFHGRSKSKKVRMIRKVVNPGRDKTLSEVMSAIELWEVAQIQLQKRYACICGVLGK